MVAAFNTKLELDKNASFTARRAHQSTRGKTLNQKHYQHCCGEDISQKQRALSPEWVLANCYSADIKEASDLLYYQAKSPGIIIIGQNGQYQFRPDKPWADKQGKKAPKYRTAYGDEYDALLPSHPTDPNFWNDLKTLKEHCYIINGQPFILVTEGAFKAIAAMIHGIPTVALSGVEMGLTPKSADLQGKRYLVPSLERFAKAGFGFLLGFDADTYRNPHVKWALIKLAHQLKKFNVPVYCLPEWDEAKGKGIDDYILMNGIEEFRKILMARANSFERWQSIYATEEQELRGKKSQKIPKADIIGIEIAEQYANRWVYCNEYKNWLAYELKFPGVWELVSKDYMETQIHNILKARGIKGYGSNSYINNILGAMKRELFRLEWGERNSSEFLPFKNGVLELATGKLHDHNPEFRLTWQLPRNYDLLSTDWSNISNWLDEATKSNKKDQHLLLCFAAAVLRGRYDLQKFLYLIGGGGSGKSTFTNLLVALIGEENTVTLNLTDLEDKHEIARVFTKRLVVMPDQDKAGKRMSNFKRLTGSDRLSGRRLFENGFEFIFKGLAIVTANFPIFHSNLGSWLIRRELMIPFDHKCPKHKQRDLMQEFQSQLSALTNYLLSIPIKEIENTLKGLGNSSSLSPTAWESMIRSDGLAAWINDHLIHDLDSQTRIGSDSREWLDGEEYSAARSSLYGSYSLYCRQTGRTTKSLQNFSAELLEQCKRILSWDLEKGKIKIAGKSVRVIKGLKLRTPNDEAPTVEEILEGDNPGDNLGTTKGDNLKPPPEAEGNKGDNLIQKSESIKNNFFPICANSETGTGESDFQKPTLTNEVEQVALYDTSSIGIEKKEVEKELSRKTNQVVPPVPTLTNQEVEVVPQAVPQVVPQVVPTEKSVDYSSYPHLTSSMEAAKVNRANFCKRAMLAVSNQEQFFDWKSENSVSDGEIGWVYVNLLTPGQQKDFERAKSYVEPNLLDMIDLPQIEPRSPQPNESVNESEETGETIRFEKVLAEINEEEKRSGLSLEELDTLMRNRYGVGNVHRLSDAQVWDWLEYLKSLPEF